MQPLHLARRGRRPRRGQQVLGSRSPRRSGRTTPHWPTPRPEPTGEHLPVVGQDLLRDAMATQRGQQRLTHRPGGGPRDQHRRHHEPGVVVDPGHTLDLDPVGQVDPTDHVHLPQLHRPPPLPAPIVAAPSTAQLRVDPAVTHQGPIDAGPTRHRLHVLLLELVADPVRTPARMQVPDRQHHRLDLRAHLVRTRSRPRAPVLQVRHPTISGITAQPAMHRLTADPETTRHLHHRGTVQDLQHCPVPLLGHRDLPQHHAAPFAA